MVDAENIVMEFDLNRGKVITLKEKIFSKSRKDNKDYEMFRALSGVSFHVNKGEIFGIIGGNGAGKSTLLKILSGIMKPTEGIVAVEGTVSPMIELGTGFDFELSAIENIYLCGSILGYNKKYIQSRVVDVLSFSELWEFKDVPVKYFSSGMIARIAFSISTMVTPEILIVDEILSVGDMSFQKKSYNKMMELMAGGTTVIYVSHDIKTLSEMCSKVMWLEKGKIKMLGESKEVCEKFIEHI